MRYSKAVSPNAVHSSHLLKKLQAQSVKVSIINGPNQQPQLRHQQRSAPPPLRPEKPPSKVQDSARVVHKRPSVVDIRQKQQMQRQDIKKKREPRVNYVTRSVDPVYLDKTRALKNTGKGKILIIIGNGPTINETDLRILKHKPGIEFMSINYPDPRLWPTNYWSFFDQSQIQRHAGLWDEYEGIIFNSSSIQRRKSGTIQFRNIGAKSFSKDLMNGICIGRSSVFASMQIALWMNFDKVYIFGVDMNPSSDLKNLHFYGTNPDVLPETRATRFEKEAEYYVTAFEAMDESERQKFVFCSSINPWPFMSMFNKKDHKTAAFDILREYESQKETR